MRRKESWELLLRVPNCFLLELETLNPPSEMWGTKCGDRRDVPRFLHATEPKEKLVNVPSVPTFPDQRANISVASLQPSLVGKHVWMKQRWQFPLTLSYISKGAHSSLF